MDKIKETGYLAGFGTGLFGIFMALAGNSVGFSNLTGQGCGVIGIAFIVLSIGSFIKPDSIGQLAMTILQNQQRAILGEQSSQTTRDPQKIILMNSDGVVSSDFGVDGVMFNPYAANLMGAETIVDVTDPLPLDTPLYDGIVGVSNIQMTKEDGSAITSSTNRIMVGFDVDFGATDIQSIRYTAWSQKTLNYKTYLTNNVLSRSCVLVFERPVVLDPVNNGDIVIAQIDIEDSDGGTSSFVNNQVVYGNTPEPFLYDLKFYQRNDGSDIVDVYYSYRGLSEINNSYVYAQFSVDGGVVWSNVGSTTLKGDFGYSVETGRRRITWEPSVDLVGVAVTNPILCRLTLYDTDANRAYGNTLTGALVMDLDKPESAIIVQPQEM